MSKLRNIEAIKKMLDGTHKMQTKKSVSFTNASKTKESLKREIGEVWVDDDGIEWEQRAGFKIKKGKLDEIRELINASKVPSNCPKCSQSMTKNLDKKFWKLEGHCFDCQIEFEHNLRIEGKYEDYERDRVLRNAEAWLKDAEQEAKEIAEAFRNPLTFANADGTIEEWSGGMNADELATKIEADFAEFKQNFIHKLKHKEEL